MRLDERGLKSAWANLVGDDIAETCYQASICPADLPAIISGYLSSTVPGDVRGLAKETGDFGNQFSPGWANDLLNRAATALLTLSAENASLKARLAGTVGGAILEK